MTLDQTAELQFDNERQHRVIVLVCHEGTESLHQGDVTLDGTTKQSLDGSGLTAAQQKELCDSGGASFGGISGHGTNSVDVTPDAP